MGIYIRVNSVPPTPGVVRIGTANVLVIGYDDDNDDKFNSLGLPVAAAGMNARVMRITSYQEFESAYNAPPDDTPLKKWVFDYYNEEAGQGVDDAELWLYRFKTSDSGQVLTDQVAIQVATVDEWRTEVSPIESIDQVAISFDGGTPVVQSASGYDVEIDADLGVTTGLFTFKPAWPKNGLGETQKIDPRIDTVFVNYTTSGISSVFKQMRKVDVQFVSLAYDNGRMTGSTPAEGIYNGTSLIDDYKQLVAYCNQCSSTGFYRMAIMALPANSKPSDSATGYGGGGKFSDLRSLDLGQNQNIVEPMSALMNVGTGSGYLGEFDNAAYMAAYIRKNPVGTDVAFTVNTSPVAAYDDEGIQLAFKSARIGTIVKASHLIDASWLNFGYTFGVGTKRWISHVRSDYQIRHLMEARLLQLMLSKKAPANVEGGYKIMSSIAASVEIARQNGWCDGLADKDGIVIPIMKELTKTNRTPTEQSVVDAFGESGVWTNIRVKYKKAGNTEQIIISALEQVVG